MTTAVAAVPEKGNCWFCGKEVGGEFFCYGCDEFVCEECDTDPFSLPFGGHIVENHQPNTPETEFLPTR